MLDRFISAAGVIFVEDVHNSTGPAANFAAQAANYWPRESPRVERYTLSARELTTAALPVELRIPRVSVFCPIKLRLHQLAALQVTDPSGAVGPGEGHRLQAGRGCASPCARATCARELRGEGLRSRA